jgi:hypothetical protein
MDHYSAAGSLINFHSGQQYQQAPDLFQQHFQAQPQLQQYQIPPQQQQQQQQQPPQQQQQQSLPPQHFQQRQIPSPSFQQFSPPPLPTPASDSKPARKRGKASKAYTVDFLILGAGWTSTFLLPLLEAHSISFATTSRTGRPGTIPFLFDPSSTDSSPFRPLPEATTILITFPLYGPHASRVIMEHWAKTHITRAHWIQLGTTAIYSSVPQPSVWITRHSPYDVTSPRAIAEDQLLGFGGVILTLAGLWGGTRQPKNWLGRVAATKDQLREKGSLSLVHGEDVARALVALHQRWPGQSRWILTDGFVYDWWSLCAGWGHDYALEQSVGASMALENMEGGGGAGGGGTGGQAVDLLQWVQELCVEYGVPALPRAVEALGRGFDSREFWTMMGITPVRGRVA